MDPNDIETSMDAVARIISDAGGRIVGRTKLQKIACLLELAGHGVGFEFRYKHYGPFSEQLATAAQLGPILEVFVEEEKRASWGGTYSVYSSPLGLAQPPISRRTNLARIAAAADSVELELAVTAAFLAQDDLASAWERTRQLKADKALGGRLEKAQALYIKLRTSDGEDSVLPAI